jgi:hypothetical protein
MTKSYLTNKEFIADVEERGYKSPIISELISRLEEAQSQLTLLSVTPGVPVVNTACPCCEAKLKLSIDVSENTLYIEI